MATEVWEEPVANTGLDTGPQTRAPVPTPRAPGRGRELRVPGMAPGLLALGPGALGLGGGLGAGGPGKRTRDRVP